MNYTVEFRELDANGKKWYVIGPYHSHPHVKAAWECESKGIAKELCDKMNAGFVPPDSGDCL